jgi:hypothetical protein
VALTLTLAAFPLGVLASHDFLDVPDSNTFHADISALAASGVTTGCGGGNYCPSAFVTREQMAAFMNRLGALGAGKVPVVNATTVDRYNANALNRVAWAADNSLEGGFANAATLSTPITTPGEGFLLIWGQSYLYLNGSDDAQPYCWLEVNNLSIPGAFAYQDLSYHGSTTDDDDNTCGVQGVFVACSAATYTVDYEVTSLGTGTPDVDALDSSLMVEYVPFNGNGDTAALSCITAPVPMAPQVHPVKGD